MNHSKLFLLLFGVILSFDVARAQCVKDIWMDVATVVRPKLERQYRKNGGLGLKMGSDPRFYWGTRKDMAVLAVHGFGASPFEVESPAKALNRAGYTVYAPLLPGFGAISDNTNRYSHEDWKKAFYEGVELLNRCFSRVAFLGFSLGGTLAIDFVLNDLKNWNKKHPKNPLEVPSMVLLAPYVALGVPAASFLNGLIGTFKSSIQLSTLYSISGNPDLVELLREGRDWHYNRSMQLKAVSRMIDFAAEIDEIPASKPKVDIPTLVIYSESDKTVDLEAMKKFIKKHFKNTETVAYTKEQKIPHQISLETANPYIKDMNSRIERFLHSGSSTELKKSTQE